MMFFREIQAGNIYDDKIDYLQRDLETPNIQTVAFHRYTIDN